MRERHQTAPVDLPKSLGRPLRGAATRVAVPFFVLGVLLAPSAAAALTISGTKVGTLPATNPVHADANTRSVIYYLDLHAGPADERFSVSLTPPAFAAASGRDEGRSVDGPLQFTLQGPGTVGQVASDPAFGALCSTRDRFHGYDSGKSTVDVALPAGANTTLAVRYGVGRRAPWSDTDLQLRFGFQQGLIGQYYDGPLFGPATAVGDAANITATQAIPVMASHAGKIGAHLVLKSSPAGTYGDGPAARSISRSTAIRVTGRLLPALGGKRVALQWAKPGGPLRTAARVMTASGGRFSANLRTPGAGAYELWASYPKQPGPLAMDSTSCPLRFKAR